MGVCRVGTDPDSNARRAVRHGLRLASARGCHTICRERRRRADVLRSRCSSRRYVAIVVPRSIRVPLEIPAERLAAVVGGWREPALLESGPGFGPSGRWSILAARPRLVFEATGTRWSIRPESGEGRSGRGDVLGVLSGLLTRYGLADPGETPDPDAPPFQGGMIGFVGYDLAPRLERLPRQARRDSRLPDLRFALYDTAVIVDHESGAVELWAHDLVEEGARAVERRCREWRKALTDAAARSAGDLASGATREQFPARRLPRRRESGAGIYRRGRRLPGEPVAAVRRAGRDRPARSLPPPEGSEPGAVRRLSPVGRPGRRRCEPGIVLSDAGRPADHAPDQGDSSPRPDPRGGRAARRRAAGEPQGSRRADHDRRPGAQRSGADLRVRDGPGGRAPGGGELRAGASPGRDRRGEAAARDGADRRDPCGLPRRVDHRCAEDSSHADHRRAGTDATEPVHRGGRLLRPGRGQRLQHRDPDPPDRRGSRQLPGRRGDRGRLGPRGRVSRDASQGRRASPGPGSRRSGDDDLGGGADRLRGEPGDRRWPTARWNMASACSRPCGPGTAIPRCWIATWIACDVRPRRFGIPLDPADLPDADAVAELLRASRVEGDARLRITATGGVSASAGSTVWMRCDPLSPDATTGSRPRAGPLADRLR